MFRGILIALLLASCSFGVNPNDTKAISSGIKVSHNNYKKLTIYSAPEFQTVHKYGMLQGWGFISLAAAKQQTTGQIVYAITLRDMLPGWLFLDEAYDIDGNKLQVNVLDRKVNCSSNVCLHTETLQIVVSRDYLEQHQQAGIKFQVSGKNGSEEYQIPSTYIKTFLTNLPF